MKRSGFKRKPTVPLKRTRLRRSGKSETALLKTEIQRLVREIVIRRDGGCVLEGVHQTPCNGYRNDGALVLQADHLVTRGNASTFADTRLIVCVCKGHHGWKSLGGNMRKAEYDAIVKTILPKERVELWERCEAQRFLATRTGAHDWKLAIAALEHELKTYL